MGSILASVTVWIIQLVSSLQYFGVFIGMTIESASIPLPSEIIMGIAGYLVYKGEMNLFVAGLIGALGNVTGSTIMYMLGVKGGRPVIKKYGKYLHFTEEKFEKVDRWFSKWGDGIVFISQVLPVIRTFISLPAGILKINFKKFLAYTFAGAFLWCTAIVYVSSLLGAQWEKISDYMKQFETVILVVIAIAILYYVSKRIVYLRKRVIKNTP